MPLFAFICKGCGAQNELLVRSDEKVSCPQCGSSAMDRQMSRFAPMSSQAAEPACCSGCAMADQGQCPSQRTGCM